MNCKKMMNCSFNATLVGWSCGVAATTITTTGTTSRSVARGVLCSTATTLNEQEKEVKSRAALSCSWEGHCHCHFTPTPVAEASDTYVPNVFLLLCQIKNKQKIINWFFIPRSSDRFVSSDGWFWFFSSLICSRVASTSTWMSPKDIALGGR